VLTGAGLKEMLPRVRTIMEEYARQWERDGRVGIFEEVGHPPRRLGWREDPGKGEAG
jgi:hypothetical protein